MPEAKPFAGVTEGEGFVARAIVGHDGAFHGDAEVCVIGDGRLEEGDMRFAAFVGLDLGEGDARGIVDADMDELPSRCRGCCSAGAIAGDGWPTRLNLPSFLMSMWISSLCRSCW